MKKSACCWCDAIVNVRDDFDQWKDMVACSDGCRAADLLFREHFSDVEMNRREHYLYLTQGTGEDHD